MKDNPASDYDFWPDAMLPAWVVTDSHLIAHNWNDFTFDLLEALGGLKLLADHSLSLDLAVSSNGKTFWECILDRKDLHYVRAGLKILQEHIAILERFNAGDGLRPFEPLLGELTNVNGYPGVGPYTYRPKNKMFRLGVKVAPPQGLKLIMKADLEGAVVEYIDIVMAYRLEADWSEPENRVRKVYFRGVQPAIHDASERHRLWEKSKEEDEARITQFLSHALKTPLANTQRILNTIKRPGLDTKIRDERIVELESLISDVDHLVGLLLFINTVEDISAPARMVASCVGLPWACFNSQDVRRSIGSALQSVHNRRTGNQVDVEKIGLLFEAKGLEVPTLAPVGTGMATYETLAGALIKFDFSDMLQMFAICPFISSGELEADKVSEKAKTVLLDLLLVELIVNAVKNADESAPVISVEVCLNGRGDKLEIRVFNNGIELKHEPENENAEIREHGEKRRALGRLLNKKAAKALQWELTIRPTIEKGTRFVIGIPLERRP